MGKSAKQNHKTGENSKKNEEAEVKFIYKPVTGDIADIFLSDLKEIPSIQIADYVFELELDPLSPEVQEIARNELRETPERTEQSLAKLRSLLEEESDLVVPIDNDHWLIRFLRPCKFYPESAFKLIKRYYAFKQKYKEDYDGLLPSNEKNVFQQNILKFQQERDHLGRRILTVELGKRWNPSEVSLDEFFRGGVLLLELGLLEPQTQVCGTVMILDMEGLSLYQTTKFTPGFFNKFLEWLQDSIPMRIKNIHIVNQPYIFKLVYNLFKPFLRPKMKNRLIFHGTDRKSLHKYLKPECLPEKYGGCVDLPTLDGSYWLELLLKCDKEYQAINRYGYRSQRKE